MKDIGLKLKEKREENGVSVDEAAEDLKMRPSQIISLEEGRKEDFSDVNTLKFFIRDYAKYLGLDGEKLVDEFNEFLFDFTSKIPSEVIEEAKQKREKEKKEFSSPYTKKEGHNKTYIICIGVCVLVLLVFIITYFVVSGVRNNDFKDDNVTYVIRR
ncbi:putative transcriptional regulator [Clostridium sp. CAG:914]|jgi:cytoskeleton protein RodZ|nr:putative transcriptional regulator [Clostridium sp. CAG:914]